MWTISAENDDAEVYGLNYFVKMFPFLSGVGAGAGAAAGSGGGGGLAEERAAVVQTLPSPYSKITAPRKPHRCSSGHASDNRYWLKFITEKRFAGKKVFLFGFILSLQTNN